MVYTGKPSRGCQTCKTRRIKCDEKRPICSQCQKSNRICPGYPDEFDLVFRNENVALERKARKASGPKSGSQPSPSSLSPASSFEIVLASSPSSAAASRSSSSASPSDTSVAQLAGFSDQASFQAYMWNLEHTVPTSLTMAPEVEATAFFFRNFISSPQQTESMRGFLELLLPLYNQARPSSALHLATNAVALAACGQYPDRQALLVEATKTYGQALRKVNNDLADPAVAKSDETVLAILIFSLYETIMSTNDTITGWANHVEGAVALTKLRGDEQFKSPISAAVFRAVRTVMITSCVQLSKPVESFPGRHGWMGDLNSEENAANRLTLICIDLPGLRARATSLCQSPRTESLEAEARSLLEYAQMVDANLLEWSRTLPADWYPQTVGMVYEIPDDVSTSEQWIGPQQAYEDVHIASVVNDYRVCRIFCQSVILACSTWLTPEGGDPMFQDSYLHAAYVIQDMVDEICACVPYHMRYDMQNTPRQLGLDESAVEAMGGYFLVWPLYVAANAETVPERQREWLKGRLFYIGRTFGLSAAQVLVLARRHVLTCGPMFNPGAAEV